MRSATKFTLLAIVAALCLSGAQARKGFGPGGQEYGYVDVRDGAHMFYWLYYVKGGEDPAGKPLVIWLQGGPGASSTSYGNFEELGPLKPDLSVRNTTWVNHVNVMFVDNPVGTGFSYVDRRTLLTTNNKQIADDLVAMMRGFLNKHPQFRKVPVYIFSESYGGKMAAEFALYLDQERKAGKIDVNFQGVALGDSWISPIDSVITWAPFLLNTGMVDVKGYKAIDALAQRTRVAVERGRYFQATQLWSSTEQAIMKAARRISFYNILEKMSVGKAKRLEAAAESLDSREFMFRMLVARDSDAALDAIMNSQVKKALDIPSQVTHQTSSSPVFNALYQDFMRPVTDVVERLLNETTLEVVVFSGQLDLIVDTPGTLAWAERLKWKHANSWVNDMSREPLTVDGVLEGFVKKMNKFTFYWINRAGHMVPSDNPAASIEMLRQVTGFK